MKKLYLTLAGIFMLLSCENKNTEDFTDQAISLAIESRKGQSIELPDLYGERVRNIPPDNAEKLILVQRLEGRGFKTLGIERGTSPLAGIRSVTVKLSKENCICEVTKIYRSTEFVSEYNASERIRCY